jgi:hypothetical protein
MKKMIVAVTALGIAAASIQTASAGDREWATVGKILTGVAVAGFVANAIDARPVSYSVSYSSYAPAPVRCVPAPVVCAPAPRVVYVPAPVVYHPQPVYVTTYSPREHRGFAYGHHKSERRFEHGHCR